jgi:hypothetical protein
MFDYIIKIHLEIESNLLLLDESIRALMSSISSVLFESNVADVRPTVCPENKSNSARICRKKIR